jgi:hypothetical protein
VAGLRRALGGRGRAGTEKIRGEREGRRSGGAPLELGQKVPAKFSQFFDFKMDEKMIVESIKIY